MTILESKDFKLRPWLESDVDSLVEVANNKKIFDGLRDGFPHPYTMEDAKNWIKMAQSINDPVPKFFAVDGNAVGSFGISLKEDIYRMNAEIGYFIGEPYWNHGIITKAIQLIVDYVFNTFDVIRIYAEPYANNKASRRTLEKAGFKCEAILHKNVIKNGEIMDSCIYSLLKED